MKDSPKRATFVFAFEAAVARISANSPASLAWRPNAVKASVTMSETVPSSSPDAAASDMMPPMPSAISAADHPAIPIYSKASPASVAENFVVAPISFALSRRRSISSPVAPEIAPTFDICSSKSAVVFTAAAPTAAIGAVIAAESFVPAEDRESPMDCRDFPASPRFVRAADAFAASVVSFSSSCSVRMISLCRASYLSLPSSPRSICSCACRDASFRVSSFCLVFSTWLARASCFCERSSTFVGSSFNSRPTSMREDCVFFRRASTSFNASWIPVVEPFISRNMPRRET